MALSPVAPMTKFTVDCSTSAGDFTMIFSRELSPHGFDRLYELFSDHFYDGTWLYRVVPGFLVQWGIPSNEAMKLKYHHTNAIPDDPLPSVNNVKHPAFRRGTISFAGSGPNSRVSDLFISYVDSSHLGRSPWESPVGFVSSGMDVIERFKSYGDISAFNKAGPNPNKIRNGGAEYVSSSFPDMDSFKRCTISTDRPALAKEKPPSLAKAEAVAAPGPAFGNLDFGDPFVLMNLGIMLVSGLLACLLLFRLILGGGGRERRRASSARDINR